MRGRESRTSEIRLIGTEMVLHEMANNTTICSAKNSRANRPFDARTLEATSYA